MEYLLRYSILALLDQPSANMQDIMALFVERDFPLAVIKISPTKKCTGSGPRNIRL